MSSELAIKIQNVSKCYHIYGRSRDRLRQLFAFGGKKYYREFWALNDVSFEIPKGETVGVIGRNGSGKSTLLQLICGTLEPTSGSIVTNGRIAALLELGAGFNPEFTGRENVYMSCTLLGMKKDEIDARFDDIAAFADIGSFLDQPVKTYSSGMFVRLAFSVNIMSQPEIMIVDEALSVGDMNFQAKCMTALRRIQDGGATVLFVSHDIGAIKSLCSKAVHLENGIMRLFGKAPDVADQYMRFMREERSVEQRKFAQPSSRTESLQDQVPEQVIPQLVGVALKRPEEFERRVSEHRYGSGEARITYAEILNLNDEPVESVSFNQEVKIRIYLEVYEQKKISVGFHIQDDRKINITGAGFANVGSDLLNPISGSAYLVDYRLSLPIQDGIYSISTQITSQIIPNVSAEFIDVVPDAVVFRVEKWPMSRIWSKVFLFPELTVSRLEHKAKT